MLAAATVLIVGLAVLTLGAELLVRGAAGIAARLGIDPLVIGLTIVAFGTSSPEVAVSVSAALSNQPDIAVGNVVGSNIFNVLFILGVSAVITPLVVQQKLIRIDVPIMIGASLVLWGLCADGSLGRLDGALLLAGIVAYTVSAIRLSKRETASVVDEYADAIESPVSKRRPMWVPGVLVLAGLGLCVAGARLMVDGAVTVARGLGVSELVTGLTILAAGTSLPEVATSILAACRGQRDIAVGNIVGSNIFNILGILGLASVAAPAGVGVSAPILGFDLPVMTAVALACLPIFFTRSGIQRWEGALLLGFYIAYVTFLVLSAGRHDALGRFEAVMLWFVLPLAGLGIAASVAGALASRRRGRSG